MRKIFGIGFVAIIASMASPAFALDPGYCAPAAELQAALKAEGQMPVVIGNRVTTRKDRPVNIFTSDANGYGYALEGDAPQGQKSVRICVAAHYHGVRINDISSDEIPTWALLGNDRKRAEADCKSRKADLCDSYDDYIKRSYAAGRRVMLIARADYADEQGILHNGRLITVVFDPSKKLADVTFTSSRGASESGGGLESVYYTQFAKSFIVTGG